MVLIKRTNTPLDKKIVDKIVERELDKESSKFGVETLTSLYVNGIYDWVICFYANDIRDAKRFCEKLNKTFEGYILETHLLEKMFAAKKSGILNPEISKLRDFFNL
jgi:hypothetical protein